MKIPKQSPLRQIRKFCVTCCGGHVKSVRFCHSVNCELWFFRFGRFPRTVVREFGKSAEQLFEPKYFEIGCKFSPDKSESDYIL